MKKETKAKKLTMKELNKKLGGKVTASANAAFTFCYSNCGMAGITKARRAQPGIGTQPAADMGGNPQVQGGRLKK